ncbi:hypothetical protein AA313_de0203799 [Arthrobotrys entomopaga]|nr:hypothetical protein AA313_de0203799 [Arthrobotrys entomopaga]
MKLLSTVVIFSTAVAVAAQANGPALPECAAPCIEDGLGSSTCDPSDIKCQCTDSTALTAVLDCVKSNCDASQIPTIIQAASAICAQYGASQAPGIFSSILGNTGSPTSTSQVSETSSGIEPGTATTTKTGDTTLRTITESTPSVAKSTSAENTAIPTSTGAPNESSAIKNTAGGIYLLLAIAGLLIGL